MFIRFVAGSKKSKINKYHGIITQAEIMKKKGILSSEDTTTVEEIFEYFNNRLPCPPFKRSNWPNNAISWFKDTAKDYISKMYELKEIIEKYGYDTMVVKEKDPGKRVYEDEYQVITVNRKF